MAAKAKQETLLVLVPCLDEAGNLRETIDAIRAVATSLPLPVDVLMIDDGSRDATAEVMRAICDEHGYRMRQNARNLGVGRSLLDSYVDLPDEQWITIMPGDNEVDFRSIANFVAMRESYDLILGYLQNPVIRPVHRRLASWAYSRTVATLYGFPFRYLNGMKLFRAGVFKGVEVTSSGHAFNAELLAKAVLRRPHLRIAEAPFVARGRLSGGSKAFRPRAIGQAALEVGLGWRSVSQFRHRVITDPTRELQLPVDSDEQS